METLVRENVSSDLLEFLTFLVQKVREYRGRFAGRFLCCQDTNPNYEASWEKMEEDFFVEAKDKWLALSGLTHSNMEVDENEAVIREIVRQCMELAEKLSRSIHFRVPGIGPKECMGDMGCGGGCYNYLNWSRMMSVHHSQIVDTSSNDLV